MDNLTHSLTGLMLARAGLNRICPQATAVLVLASNIPDLDIVYAMGGGLTYLEYHRHWTHGLLFAPLVALGPLAILWFAARWVKRWQVGGWLSCYLVSVLGIVGHVLFDSTNAYAVRLGLPLSAEWFSLDIFNVVDAVVLLVLLLAVVAPAIAGLVSSEIGAKKSGGAGWARFALVAILSYAGFRATLHQRAIALLDNQQYTQGTPRRVAAWPSTFSPYRWTGFVETDQAWLLYDMNINREFDAESAVVAFKPAPNAALSAAWESEDGRAFRNFARFSYWRGVPAGEGEGATAVEANDLRFGPPGGTGFAYRAVFDSQMRRLEQSFRYGTPGRK